MHRALLPVYEVMAILIQYFVNFNKLINKFELKEQIRRQNIFNIQIMSDFNEIKRSRKFKNYFY